MSAPEYRLRRRLRLSLSGPAVTVGTFLKLPGTVAVEIAASAGLDLVVVDDEHSGLGTTEILDLVRHAVRCDLPVLVRIPVVDAAWVAKLLDTGATGIQLAGLEHPDQIARLGDAAYPPPSGSRGTSLTVASARYGLTRLDTYLAAERRDRPVLIGQIESASAVDRVDDLLDGLDAIFVGTTDLTARHGAELAGELERRVIEAARPTGTPVGRFQGLGDARPSTLPGLVVVASDIAAVAAGLATIAPRWRSAP